MRRPWTLFAIVPLLFAARSARAAYAGAPSDAQIAGIVVTANQIDIDAGELARTRSRSKEVQDFAVRMVTDHTGVNQQAKDLAAKLKVTPEDSDTSETLSKGGEENLSKLKKLSGGEFDRAYVDHEVAYHQSVLDALDKSLIPNAKNAELKALLVQVRPAFESHLEHAKHLQAQLEKS